MPADSSGRMQHFLPGRFLFLLYQVSELCALGISSHSLLASSKRSLRISCTWSPALLNPQKGVPLLSGLFHLKPCPAPVTRSLLLQQPPLARLDPDASTWHLPKKHSPFSPNHSSSNRLHDPKQLFHQLKIGVQSQSLNTHSLKKGMDSTD